MGTSAKAVVRSVRLSFHLTAKGNTCSRPAVALRPPHSSRADSVLTNTTQSLRLVESEEAEPRLPCKNRRPIDWQLRYNSTNRPAAPLPPHSLGSFVVDQTMLEN